MFCFAYASTNWNYDSLKTGKLLPTPDGKLFYTAPQKPRSDSFVIENEAEILILEGVVANASRLITELGLQSLPDLIGRCIGQNSLLAKLHGQFFIARYDKILREFKVFGNVTQSVRIYFYDQDGIFIVSDKIRTIVKLLLDNGIRCSVDELGARMLLSYRHMLENYTTIRQIKNIGWAGALCYRDGKLSHSRYLKWKPETIQRTAKQTYSDLTDIFSSSVQDVLNSDGDRKHLAFLSGGLDSRMTVYTTHKLGCRDLTVLNFSDPGYLDETTSKAIADELSYKLIFHSLANGDYLKSVEDNLVYNEGQISTYAAAHLYSGIRSLDLNPFGTIQSGLFGELIKGFCLHAKQHSKADPLASLYSKTKFSGWSPQLSAIAENYPNQEQFFLCNVGFNGMINGDLACYQLSHSLSPYLDPTFIQYTLSIDPALRYQNRCQINWMKTHYPQAAKHNWDQINAPVSLPFWLIRARFLMRWGGNRIKRQLTNQPSRLSMIPHDYWWQQNPGLRKNFHDNITRLSGVKQSFSKELQRDLNAMLASSVFSDRYSAYSLLQSCEYLLVT